MGDFKIDKRLLIVGAITVAALAMVVGLLSLPRSGTLQKGDGSVTFTSPITGQQQTVYPNQKPEQVANDQTLLIDGYEHMFDIVPDYQAANIRTDIQDFINAQTGVRADHAAIQDNQITKLDDQNLQFNMVLTKPNVTYQVHVRIENSVQQTPDVTFRQL